MTSKAASTGLHFQKIDEKILTVYGVEDELSTKLESVMEVMHMCRCVMGSYNYNGFLLDVSCDTAKIPDVIEAEVTKVREVNEDMDIGHLRQCLA